MKFKPPPLLRDPTQEQWEWWRQCFEKGLVINEITDDDHKLTFLKPYAGSELYTLLKEARTLAEGFAKLNKEHIKPTRVLYSRHKLLTSKQKTAENITEYVKRLNVLVQKCNCAAITAKQHQESLIRDAADRRNSI